MRFCSACIYRAKCHSDVILYPDQSMVKPPASDDCGWLRSLNSAADVLANGNLLSREGGGGGVTIKHAMKTVRTVFVEILLVCVFAAVLPTLCVCCGGGEVFVLPAVGKRRSDVGYLGVRAAPATRLYRDYPYVCILIIGRRVLGSS